MRNIRFFRQWRDLQHSDPTLPSAGYMSIWRSKEWDKNKYPYNTLWFWLILCPISTWNKIVQRIIKYPGTNVDTCVHYFYRSGNCFEVKSDDVRKSNRAAATLIGEKIGFPSRWNWKLFKIRCSYSHVFRWHYSVHYNAHWLLV